MRNDLRRSHAQQCRFALGASILSLALAACGGDDGPQSPAPPLAIGSPAAVSVAENASGVIYTASASHPSRSPVTFAIDAGADAGTFALQPDGRLSFRQAPDFERPADADDDNVYEVRITASGGKLSKSFGLRVTVTNDKEGIAVTRIAAGFTDPVCIDFLHQKPAPTAGPQGRIVVAERGGKIYHVDGTTGTRNQIADALAERAPAEVIECKSFLRNSNSFYSGLYAVIREADGRVWMQRYDRGPMGVSQLLPSGTPPAKVKLINGPDGQFYMTVQEGGGVSAQDAGSLLGKLFRLIQNDPYAGASIGQGFFTPSLIGDGLRDSGGGSVVGDQILLSDRGQTHEHELNFFNPAARPLDFGWPHREGTVPLQASPPAAVNGPAVVYPVGSEGRSGTGVVSGWVYRGPANALKEHYVFGDRRGLIWSIPLALLTDGYRHGVDDLENRTADFQPDAGTIDSPVGFATDDFDRFYILDADGEVFRVDGA